MGKKGKDPNQDTELNAGASAADAATAVQDTGNPCEENPTVEGGAAEPSDSADASAANTATAVQDTGNPSEGNPVVDGGAAEPSDSADVSAAEIGESNLSVLEDIAKRTMRDHGLDSVYVTSDGTAFYTRHDAHNHARNLADDTILAIEPQTTIEG